MTTDKELNENRLYVFNKLRAAGKAVARVNGNNTHSGNFSMRDPLDEDCFHITASGSQCGDLIEQDIVPIRFSGVSWGDARGSSESTIHRSILSRPGVYSVIHAHPLSTIYISFDTKESQLFLEYLGTDDKNREEFLFHPIDLYGSFLIGGVRVASYEQPVGSPEMEERIPKYLSENGLTIVRGHGPFARGGSVEEALFLLDLLENSSKCLLHLKRRGISVVEIHRKIRELGCEKFYPAAPHEPDFTTGSILEVADPSVIDDFRQRLNYNYNNSIGAYGTGSMSQRLSPQEMIYCPASSVPEDFDFSIYRLSTEIQYDDSLDLKLHKMIYQHTHQNTCMITTNPLATAEGMAVLSEKYGFEVLVSGSNEISYTAEDHPVILPIDAEAIYLNPKVGLVDLSKVNQIDGENPILNMLRWYKGCCVVAGYGVISTGETTLEQAAHNASSAERIAQFRVSVDINHKLFNGPKIELFEPGS